ncbi:hypothetical protein RvY_02500-2 [Ramazzottius varieornatus]|uniref:Uncharacterized protein n=1 Tax=Ramazzottius varieornatus TaxID=947166 RepID=A0A1D1UJY7_RAMVA|nr:hypothetical protein RvY_02500-2 [Ramazzottius varieornatus]
MVSDSETDTEAFPHGPTSLESNKENHKVDADGGFRDSSYPKTVVWARPGIQEYPSSPNRSALLRTLVKFPCINPARLLPCLSSRTSYHLWYLSKLSMVCTLEDGKDVSFSWSRRRDTVSERE